MRKFGLRLREIREKSGLTLEQTEEEGWPSWQHLQRIESGKKDVSLSTLVRLSRLYKVSISEIFKGL